MGNGEKQRIMDSWKKHLKNERLAKKHQTHSSQASDDFKDSFKRGLKSYMQLTEKEKQEILVWMETAINLDDEK